MGTFTQKTDYLLETKSKIKDRLNSLGASITAQTTFRNYLTWLDNLYTALSNKNITGLPDSLEGKCEQTGTPTPTNPVPINITTGRQVVSVCGKNLANLNDTIIGKAWNNASNSARAVLYIQVQPSTDYTISYTGTSVDGVYGVFKAGKDDTTGATGVYTISGSRTLTSTATSNWLVIQFAKSSITLQDVLGLTLQVEKGTATTYEEYKGQDYEINLGKNLWHLDNATNNGVTLTNNDDGSITLNGTCTSTNYFRTTFNTPLSSDTYTLSFVSSVGLSTGSLYVRTRNSAGVLVHNLDVKTTSAIQIQTSDIKYMDITIINGVNYDNVNLKIQLEKGSVATSFSAYKTPIYLGKIGTYQDYIFKNTTENPLYDSNLNENEWYLHKEIGKRVFNGSENFYTQRNTSPYIYGIGIADYLRVAEKTSVCNYFESVINGTAGSMTDGQSRFRYYNDSDNSLYFCTSQFTTLANFKTWLSTHNTEVYYILNTPTNTLIEDEELINQLNEIEIFTVISEDFYN